MGEILPVPVQEAKEFYGKMFEDCPSLAKDIVKIYEKAYRNFYDVCKSRRPYPRDIEDIEYAAMSIEKAIDEMHINPNMQEERDIALKLFQLKSMLKNMKRNDDIAQLRGYYNVKYGI